MRNVESPIFATTLHSQILDDPLKLHREDSLNYQSITPARDPQEDNNDSCHIQP